MGIKNRISSTPVNNVMDSVQESLYRQERDYRTDRLVEKWSNIPEIGKGIQEMPQTKARNLAVLLENEARVMSRMTEAQLSSTFNG